jgi:hypothetical protein
MVAPPPELSEQEANPGGAWSTCSTSVQRLRQFAAAANVTDQNLHSAGFPGYHPMESSVGTMLDDQSGKMDDRYRRLRDLSDQLRAAVLHPRAREVPRTALLLGICLSDIEFSLADPPGSSRLRMEKEISRAESLLAAWNALISF